MELVIYCSGCGVGKDEAQEKDMRAEDQGRVEDNLREDEFNPRVHMNKGRARDDREGDVGKSTGY